jgi:hypothetical protein
VISSFCFSHEEVSKRVACALSERSRMRNAPRPRVQVTVRNA